MSNRATKHTTQTHKVGLRHGGNIFHEVPLNGITEREILLLRKLHGEDAVVGLVVDGEMSFPTEKDELYYLARKYANTSDPASGRRLVESMFSTPLIHFDAWLEEQRQLEEMERNERQERHEAEIRRIEDEREQKRLVALAQALRQPEKA